MHDFLRRFLAGLDGFEAQIAAAERDRQVVLVSRNGVPQVVDRPLAGAHYDEVRVGRRRA